MKNAVHTGQDTFLVLYAAKRRGNVFLIYFLLTNTSEILRPRQVKPPQSHTYLHYEYKFEFVFGIILE